MVGVPILDILKLFIAYEPNISRTPIIGRYGYMTSVPKSKSKGHTLNILHIKDHNHFIFSNSLQNSLQTPYCNVDISWEVSGATKSQFYWQSAIPCTPPGYEHKLLFNDLNVRQQSIYIFLLFFVCLPAQILEPAALGCIV